MSNTTTKFHPILFSIPMVQSILEGKKTQTRRVVKYPLKLKGWHLSIGESSTPPPIEFCPYEVGDVLWARETFRKVSHYGFEDSFIEYKSGGNNAHCKIVDEEQIIPVDKWKPSIHMPKEYARIFLRIKSRRVQRLQEISGDDAKQEGVKDRLNSTDLKLLVELGDWKIPRPFNNYQFGFLSIWCSLYRCENWLENPFVWVYEFEKIEKPLDFI